LGKVILKTALKTLVAAVIAVVIAFAVLSFGFPQTMASAFENLGCYSVASEYASIKYNYSGKTEDLARCAEDCIAAGSDKRIVEFCVQLKDKEDFDAVCAEKDKNGGGYSYRQFIYGKLSVSAYRIGDVNAVAYAKEGMGGVAGFPKNNSLAALSLFIAEGGAKEEAEELLKYIEEIGLDGDEYYDAVRKVLQKAINEQEGDKK